MKKRLLFIFGMISCWISLYAQAPDLIYYKFEDSTGIINYATNPVGSSPISINSMPYIDTGGFLNTKALTDTGGPKSPGGIHTGWNTQVNGSFTISFWYYNPTPDTSGNYSSYYLFGDSLANVHSWITENSGNVSIFLQISDQLTSGVQGYNDEPHFVHFVYDDRPSLNAPYGVFSFYMDALLQQSFAATAPINISGGELILGRNRHRSRILDNFKGKLDEFRWYSRALSGREITNTYNIDVNPLGICSSSFSSFTLDSISGQAAKLQWVPGNGNTSYFIEYDTAGFTPGTGTLLTGNYPADTSMVILTGLIPETEYDVYFGEKCTGRDSIYNKAPYSFETTVACQDPIHFQISNITATSADMQWDHIGPLQEFYVRYVPKGLDPATYGGTDTLTSTSHALTNLIPGIRYDIYLTANCGSGNGSSNMISSFFITKCLIFTAPFFEDFEDSTWIPHFSGNDTINNCWEVDPNYIETGEYPSLMFRWGVATGDIATWLNAPSSGKGGSGNYLFAQSSFLNKPGDIADIYSPTIDVSTLNVPYLSFFYHRYGAGQPDVYIDVNDGSGWNNVLILKDGKQLQSTDPYDSTGVDISSFGDTIQVRFRGLHTSYLGITGIDDFEIKEAPPVICEKVDEIAILGSDQDTSVTIDLLTEGYNFNLEWGPPGFEQGTGCHGNGPSPFTIDNCIGLNATYDLYIQNNCQDSGLGVSSWAGPFTFCGAFTAPYSHNFDQDSPGFSPQCWEEYSRASIGAGSQEAEVYQYEGWAFSDMNVLRLSDVSINNGDTIMSLSPRFIDLPEGNKQIRFLAYAPSERYGGTFKDEPRELVVGTMSSYDNGASFQIIDTISINRESWKEYIVNLDSNTSLYNGTDQIIALRYLAKGNIYTTDFCYIDNFHYEEASPCAAPSTLSFKPVFITANTAELNWKSGSGSSFELAWGSPGFTPGSNGQSGTSVSSDSAYTISGLSPKTRYDVYVRTDCGGDFTHWVGPLEITTACSLAQAPYFENFDGPQGWFAPSRAFNAYNCGDSIDECWSRIGTCKGFFPSEVHYTWGVQKSTYHPQRENYIFPVYSPNKVDTADISSPVIDISSLNTPYLSLYYHRKGLDIADVFVDINDGDGSGWHTVLTFKGEQQNSYSDVFRKAGADISSFGDTIQVRFRAAADASTYSEMAIDEFSIDEAPSCIDPENLSAGAPALDTASERWVTTLNWEDFSGLASAYEVWWGPEGFSDPASSLGSGHRTTTLNSYYATDTLRPGTCYEFLVRSICGPGDTGNFVGPYSFCIPCAPQIAPYIHSFSTSESLEAGDGCWYQQYRKRTSGEYKWVSNSGPTRDYGGIFKDSGPLEGVYGSDYVFTKSENGANGDSVFLFSPLVDISALSTPEMSFYYHLHGNEIDTLYVDLFDGREWYDGVVVFKGRQQSKASDPWKEAVVDLTPYNSTGFIQARFRLTRIGNFEGDAAIDEFRISDSLTCPHPFNFRFEDSLTTEVLLRWSGSSAEDNLIEYAPTGYVYGQGTEVMTIGDSIVIPVNDNRVYDGYLRTICGPGDTSYLLGPLQFHSKVFPCDDMEAYTPGPLDGQSSLYRPWDYNAPGGGFDIDGDDEISTTYAASGTQSLHMYEGTNSGAGILTDVRSINSGMYSVGFNILITDTGGAFYEILYNLTTTGINTDYSGDAIFYFNKQLQRCQISRGDLNFTFGSFPFRNSWNEVQHIFDFDNDTTWMIINGTNIHLGWEWEWSEPFVKNFRGLHFLTTPDNINTTGKASDFYLDDFCIETYVCPAPSGLTIENTCTKAVVSWQSGVDSSTTVFEYDTAGFSKGTGNISYPLADRDTLTGLIPGSSYDIYVGEICGYDTVYIGPLTISLPSEAIADFTIDKGNPTATDLTVDFDGSMSVGAEKFFWDFGDGSTDSAEAPVHTFTVNGTYTVQLIISSDCGSDTIVKTVEISGISVEENILSQSLKVYPNPTEGRIQLHFETQSSEDAVIRLTDLSGKVISQRHISDINGSYEGELNINHLPQGTYLLKIRSGEMKAVKRIVKQ